MIIKGALNRNNKTYIEHEDDLQFNAPHYYEVKDKETEEILTKISFQLGPIREHGINGITNEDLLSIVIDRLNHFQKSKYSCLENRKALDKITEGLMWLNKRTHERESRGVEGTSNL